MTEPTLAQSRGTFWLACRVEIVIESNAAKVWDILTDANGYPRWNSTITRIEGNIRRGEQLRLHVPGTTRTFTPTVRDMVPAVRMSWIGGVTPLFKGVRTFGLAGDQPGSTIFSMEERFSGVLIPLVRSTMPDFGPIFARFASDLRLEAERR